ncbi:MAG: omptin family outer membrane protease [bacterium]|nr:omptin family outer membrane protease [bacterium]
MKSIVFILKILILNLVLTTNLMASLSYDLKGGVYRGSTTYQIGGFLDNKNGQTVFHFPVSDLKFPLNVYIMEGQVIIPFLEKFSLGISAIKSISRGAGTMQDSDWLKADYEKPDIYSESTTALNLFQYDFKLKYKIREINCPDNNKQIFWFGLGYLYKRYDINISNLEQWFPREPEREHIFNSGKALTYEAKYSIPFIDFSYAQTFGKLAFGFNVGVAPSVKVEDRDDHILRSKLALGNADGNAFLLSGYAKYAINKNWFGILSSQYTYLYAAGKQNQTRYEDTKEGQAGHIADLDNKIKNENYNISFGLQYCFSEEQLDSLTKTAPSTTSNSIIKPFAGMGYIAPFKELESTFGPSLGFEAGNFFIGAEYYKGQNKIQTLSMGTYSLLPVYGTYKLPLNELLSLSFGVGYSFNSNKLDPQIVSHLAYLGYANAQENIKSSPFLLANLEINAPYSQGNVKYILQYKYDKTSVEAKDDSRSKLATIDLSSLCFIVKVKI